MPYSRSSNRQHFITSQKNDFKSLSMMHMEMEMEMEMEDYTEYLLAGQCGRLSPILTDCDESLSADSGMISLSMLRKRPDIKSAIMDAIGGLLPKPSAGDADDEVTNRQILELIKSDPFIEGTIYECIIGMSDMIDDEGEEMYIPSIFDTDDAQELIDQIDNGGFREDYEPIPAKYYHLSAKNIDMVYKQPEVRKILSKLPADVITDDFVESLCK